MTIYLVASGEYSEYGVDAVFLNKEKAMLYCAAHNGKETDDPYDICWIEEYDTHDDDINADGKKTACRHYLRFGVFDKWYVKSVYIAFSRPSHISEDLHDAWVYLPQEDDDLAIKIAQDMAAEAKARKEGLT